MHRGRQFDSYTEKIHEPSNHRRSRKFGNVGTRIRKAGSNRMPGFLPNGLTASFGRIYPARPNKSRFAVRLGSVGTESPPCLNFIESCKRQACSTWRRFGSASRPLPHSSRRLLGGSQKSKQGESSTRKVAS